MNKKLLVRFKFIISGGDAIGILRHNHNIDPNFSNYDCGSDNIGRYGAIVLTVTEGSTVKTYSMAALQALPSVSGSGGSLGKGGTITGPFLIRV